MECTVNWRPRNGMGLVAETGSGHLIDHMDGAPDGGPRPARRGRWKRSWRAPAGCTAYDVVLILKRGRHDARLPGQALGRTRRQRPWVFTRIHIHSSSPGMTCPLARWSAPSRCRIERYCSASIMLAKTAQITTSHEVVAV